MVVVTVAVAVLVTVESAEVPIVEVPVDTSVVEGVVFCVALCVVVGDVVCVVVWVSSSFMLISSVIFTCRIDRTHEEQQRWRQITTRSMWSLRIHHTRVRCCCRCCYWAVAFLTHMDGTCNTCGSHTASRSPAMITTRVVAAPSPCRGPEKYSASANLAPTGERVEVGVFRQSTPLHTNTYTRTRTHNGKRSP